MKLKVFDCCDFVLGSEERKEEREAPSKKGQGNLGESEFLAYSTARLFAATAIQKRTNSRLRIK